MYTYLGKAQKLQGYDILIKLYFKRRSCHVEIKAKCFILATFITIQVLEMPLTWQRMSSNVIATKSNGILVALD
jgi:hypothetical protein